MAENETTKETKAFGEKEWLSSDIEHKLYEVGYMLTGTFPEEKANEAGGKIRSFIEGGKNIVVEETLPKLKKLAYPIKKQTDGFFGWIKFLAKASDIKEITEKIEKMPEMLRMLIVETKREELTERRAKAKRKVLTEEEKTQIQEIDKKLEEMLGN